MKAIATMYFNKLLHKFSEETSGGKELRKVLVWPKITFDTDRVPVSNVAG